MNALRAFESAARLGSFTAAAEELSVTPGAVAQHVKSLEQWAESALFVRNRRGVVLTPLGDSLLPRFSAAFDQLNEAVQALRTTAAPRKVRLATLPSIAQLWLSERLGRLRAMNPDISVSVVATETSPNLERELFDLSLYFEDEPVRRGGVRLFQDCIFPVCSRSVAAGLRTEADLARVPLLHDSTWGHDWEMWLDSLPHHPGIRPAGPAHSLFSVALEEARNGAGILMAHKALVQPLLDSGELVAPFVHRLALGRYLVLRMTPRFANSETGKLFKEVVREERSPESSCSERSTGGH